MHCGVMCTEWTFENCWISREVEQFYEDEDFSETFDDRIMGICAGSLKQIADQLDSLFRRDSGMDKMRCEIGEQANPGLVGTQQNHGLLCLERQCNF